MDPTVQTALIGAAATVLTLVIAEAAKRWKTSHDKRAAEAATRVTDADAEVRTTDALGAAFRTITESLTIIHDLRARLGKVETDLMAARSEIEALQRANTNLKDEKISLTTQLELERQEKLAAKNRLELARGDIRILKDVLSSHPAVVMPKLASERRLDGREA